MQMDRVVYSLEQRGSRFDLGIIGIQGDTEAVLYEKNGLISMFAALREAEKWASENKLATSVTQEAPAALWARTAVGRKSEAALLAADAALHAPSGLRVAVTSEDSITLAWEANGNPPGTKYEVELAVSNSQFRGNPVVPTVRDLHVVAELVGTTRYTHRFENLRIRHAPVLCRVTARLAGSPPAPGDPVMASL